MKEILYIIAKKSIESTKFNRLNRAMSSDSISWNKLAVLECNRWDKPINEYNVPNIVTTIFSSDKPLIFGKFEMWFRPSNREVSCVISVEKMDSKSNCINVTKRLLTQVNVCTAVSLPTPIIILENFKYKIQLDFSMNVNLQLKKYANLKQEVILTNGAKITFHRDELSDFDTTKKGVIDWLYFNEINS